jgi:biotin-(acetyl-CoA carboxylase) ligase
METIERLFENAIEKIKIKWPNDVYSVEGDKLGKPQVV